MKIQIGHSQVGDFINELYKPLSDSFEEHDFLFPHEEGCKAPNSRETLKQQDVFLCEVSHHATGLGIELGFASIYGIRIICMYKKGAEISGSLKYVSDEIFEYSDSEDMIGKLKNIL